MLHNQPYVINIPCDLALTRGCVLVAVVTLNKRFIATLVNVNRHNKHAVNIFFAF